MRPSPTTPPSRLRPRTAVAPLTTVFRPPQSCLDAPFTLLTTSTGSSLSTAWRDKNQTSAECYPQSFLYLEGMWNWYSPGVCPSGYSVAQTSKPNTVLTQAWCCPAGFGITGSLGTNGDYYEYCTSSASSTALISAGANATTTIIPTYSFLAYQWPISVEWASSDLSLFTPISAPFIPGDASSTIVSDTVKATPSGNHDLGQVPGANVTTAASNPALSAGVTAAIGVGSAVAFLAIVAGIFFCWRRRRRSAQRIPIDFSKGDQPSSIDQKVELSHQQTLRKPMSPPPVELDTLDVHELGAADRYKKRAHPVELEGDWYGNETQG